MGSCAILGKKNLNAQTAQEIDKKEEMVVEKTLMHKLVGEVEDLTTMATEEMEEDNVERPRWSVRKWKRQARGNEHNGEQSQ
jgi:hypothetical protein